MKLNSLQSKLMSIFIAAMISAGPVFAQVSSAETPEPTRPIAIYGRYVFDLAGVVAGGDARGKRVLGNLEISADADLYRLAGWKGATARLHVLANHGGSINELAGTLQGVNNIEVTEARAKLYEAWVEQSFADDRASLLVGLADLNATFYQNDSGGLLIAPAFGIGSELAATGPNGPSIFHSTALTARLNFAVAKSGYVRGAVVNARAGVLGDRAGIDFSMQDGVLLIAEAGTTRGGKLAVGFWRYTHSQDDIREVDVAGDPVQRAAMGAYLLVDQRVAGDDVRGVNFFLRAGFSDGDTTPFRGGFQSGLLIRGYVPGRPEGQFSIGVAHGALSNGFRRNLEDLGEQPASAETGFELTYIDMLTPFLSVQPDLQYVRRAYASEERGAVVLGLRVILTFDRR